MKTTGYVFGAAAILLLFGAGAAQASMDITTTGTTDAWTTESGTLGVTPGTVGWVGGTLNAIDASSYQFTYLGYGDASNINEFWVGTSQAAAEAAGQFFCTHGCGSYTASTIGANFKVDLAPGAIPFGFLYDQADAGGHTLLNGGSDDANGAYLVTTAAVPAPGPGSTTANAGPNPYAYIGLADRTYPTLDADFQDMTIQVAEVPEPASLAILGIGLAGLGVLRRRRG